MIQANELRVGNHFIGGKVESITTTGINFYSGYEGYIETPIEQLQPVPLTPELLEKCGFVYRKRWEHDLLANYIYQAVGFYMNDVVPEIKYLHQLQNLYFALTGEELNVQL